METRVSFKYFVNGCRYKRVPRSELPPNVIMQHNYRQRAAPRRRRRRRRGQCGRILFSFIKKVAKNPMGRELAKKGVQHLPGLYNAATSSIKNDKIRNALHSDTAKELLNKAVQRYR